MFSNKKPRFLPSNAYDEVKIDWNYVAVAVPEPETVQQQRIRQRISNLEAMVIFQTLKIFSIEIKI